MSDEIKEILGRLERIDHKEYSCGFEFADSGSFDETARCFVERKKMADYITNLQQENERLKGLCFIQHEEYEKLFNHLIIDKPRERIKKAINIYDNRNSLKYKKQRFMQGKTTADLMYEALQNGSEDDISKTQ